MEVTESAPEPLFDDGLPDVRLAPMAELARAYRRSMSRPRNRTERELRRGNRRLRQAISRFVSRARGVSTSPDNILVTRGSQMGIYLAAQTSCEPGARIGVEEPGYPPARQALHAADVNCVPIPVDEQGIRIDRLMKAHQESSLDGLYLTPHHQYPTTVTLSPARRIELLDLADHLDWLIIEDDYDFEYHFDVGPEMPLSASESTADFIYLGSFSKLLSPSIRLGFYISTPDRIERAAQRRKCIDGGGDLHLERSVEELLTDGELARHARRVRSTYEARRDNCIDRLSNILPNWSWDEPTGGLAIWLRGPSKRSVEELHQETAFATAAAQSENFYQTSTPEDFMLRLGYGSLTEEELQDRLLNIPEPIR